MNNQWAEWEVVIIKFFVEIGFTHSIKSLIVVWCTETFYNLKSTNFS